MDITWKSQRGNERRCNNDAIALGYKNNFFLAVLVDAAENKIQNKVNSNHKKSGKRFASHWADNCLIGILSSDAYASEETLRSELSHQQSKLRHCFLHDIASYGVLTMNLSTGDLCWLYTGDCRFGVQLDQGKIDWLNTPHRMDESIQTPHPQEYLQHLLTDCLNARRFSQPTKVTAKIPVNTTKKTKYNIVIGTDGYWCEHLQHGVPMENLTDDASFLVIKHGDKALHMQTDTPNLLIVYDG